MKAITALDKKRLAFKPEKGQSQWSRSCQNSGTDKKRRPKVIPGDQPEKLIKMGFKFNKQSGFYEREIELKIKGKKYKKIIRAVKQYIVGDSSKFNYFTCDPNPVNGNGEHTFIGFLSRGTSPDDLPLPCCFKKDQYTSTNKKKRLLFEKAIGIKNSDEKIEKKTTDDIGDKLYILQDTNKVQEGRFIHLLNDLDLFFNKIWNHDNTIKNHYLTKSKSGYFCKFTVKDKNYNFLAAISNIFDLTIDQIKEKLIDFLEKDKNNLVYTYLNNGDIKSAFGEKKNFINYIKTSFYLEYDIVGELLSIEGVISKKPLFFFIMEKKTKFIKKDFESTKTLIKHVLKCNNIENNQQINRNNDFIILIKEGRYYFPIYRVKKDDSDKKIILDKRFSEDGNASYIINELKKYYGHSCLNSIITKINKTTNLENKNLISILEKNDIKIKMQLIDSRNKARYLLLDNLIIPVEPSGINYKYPILNKNDFNEKKYFNLETYMK